MNWLKNLLRKIVGKDVHLVHGEKTFDLTPDRFFHLRPYRNGKKTHHTPAYCPFSLDGSDNLIWVKVIDKDTITVENRGETKAIYLRLDTRANTALFPGQSIEVKHIEGGKVFLSWFSTHKHRNSIFTHAILSFSTDDTFTLSYIVR